MNIEKIAVFASVGFAIAIAAFVIWGPSPKHRKRGTVIGINNLGHTCFLNSLLQALAACPIFIRWLRKQYEANRNVNFISTSLSVFEKINGYTDDLYSDVTPTEIISSLGSQWKFASGYQDVHELFHVVLSALQTEIQHGNRKSCLTDALPSNYQKFDVSCNDTVSANKSRNIQNDFDGNCNNYIETPMTFLYSDEYRRLGTILDKSLERFSKNVIEEEKVSFKPCYSCSFPIPATPPISIVVHPFSGLLTSQLQCSCCKWKSAVRYDKLEIVSLPLPPLGLHTKSYLTLEELLTHFVTTEIVQNILCNGCGMYCFATKTITLGKLPKCLCLHISRTTWSSSGIIKRNDPVKFPEVLTLDPYTFLGSKKRNAQDDPKATKSLSNQTTNKQDKHKYQLRAIVEHRGPVDSGHFICYRQGNEASQWLYTSDNVVKSISLIEVLHAKPYLLFYERINSK